MKRIKETLLSTSGKLPIAVILVVCFLLQGCQSLYYLPTSHNIPLLSEKGQSRISATLLASGVHGGQMYGGMQANAGLALAPHGALLLGGMECSSRSKNTHHELHAGYGYYGSNRKGNIIYEAYGILALGGASQKGSASYLKEAVQVNVGYKIRFLEIALSWRVAGLHFTSLEGTSSDSQLDMAVLRSHSATPLSEPALLVRLGFRNFKLEGQAGYSFNPVSGYYPIGNFQTGFGMSFVLN